MISSHLTEDPPTDDSKDQWLEDDAGLFLHSFSKSIIPLTVKYLLSLIIVSLLRS